MSDWWEEPEVVEAPPERAIPASPLKGKASLAKKADKLSVEAQHEALVEIESEIYERMMKVVDGAGAFGEIDPENPDEVPQEWVESFGPEQAKIRHRLARYALMPSNDAPVGLKMAAQTFVGMAKARAVEKQGPRELNLIQVSMPGPPRMYDSIELDEK